MQGPRADFACLSKKCQQDGAATVYELPVSATRCPVCGSKRLQRLYNAVQVATGLAHSQAGDRIARTGVDEAHKVRQDSRDALQQQRVSPSLAVPISQVGGILQGLAPGKATVDVSPRVPILGHMRGAYPAMKEGSQVDTRYKGPGR